jgi:hypothetical protein
MMKQNGSLTLGGAIALGALLALAGTAHAQTAISGAAAGSDLHFITIKGTGLQPPSGNPTVSLESYSLTVGSFTNVQITAALPANLKPGTYNLAVAANGTANFDVTIGAAGPVGPAGPAGPQGPPGPGFSLPFSGSVATNDPAIAVSNTGGTAISALGYGGYGATIAGGVSGGTALAGVLAVGGGGSGVSTGGPGFSGTGGIGANSGGDGVDVTGAAVTGYQAQAGAGVTATGGAAGINGSAGNGITAYAGSGDSSYGGPSGANGIFATGGSTIAGCSLCTTGAGGYFQGGGNPNDGSTFGGDGVHANPGSNTGVGIYALSVCAAGTPPCNGYNSVAGLFSGDVYVDGNLSKNGGSFKIDHPLDPANKYLYHSFVESPDMMNIYNGDVTTDGGGHATVTLPDWFEALNSDFRYQLTVIGQFSQAIVASKINHNTFAIRTDKPNVEVSWQVTGIRQDAWANAHRIPVEAEKTKADQGHYLHPELFDHAGEPGITELHHPRPKQRQQQ